MASIFFDAFSLAIRQPRGFSTATVDRLAGASRIISKTAGPSWSKAKGQSKNFPLVMLEREWFPELVLLHRFVDEGDGVNQFAHRVLTDPDWFGILKGWFRKDEITAVFEVSLSGISA